MIDNAVIDDTVRTMRLTIGTAAYDDFDGVFFTLESLRTFHDLARYQCEILVVDNHPAAETGDDLRHYVGSIVEVPARYIPYPDPVGTSAPRNQVFSAARGDVVLVMDCHVIIERGGIPALLDFFAEHPEPAIVSGPLLMYDRKLALTHMAPVWRDGMWGIWQTDERWKTPEAEPFEIPAMGLGLFACQRRHWPGFHPLARGFGGEECYIHEKIRASGGRAWCLPRLRWIHRFHNQTRSTRYPNLWRDRIRNYILEFLDLGRDLTPIRDHFVAEKGIISDEEFARIASECREETRPPTSAPPSPAFPPAGPPAATIADASSVPAPAPAVKPKGCGCGQRPVRFPSLDDWIRFEREQSQLGPEALQAVTDAARDCSVVTDLWPTPTTAAAALAARPHRYVGVGPDQPTAWWPQVTAVRGETMPTYLLADPRGVTVPNTDCLIVRSASNADDLLQLLAAYRPRRRVIVFGTTRFAEFDEGGTGPGLRPGLRRFVRENAGWVVVRSSSAGDGYAVLSADPADRKALPGTWRQVHNFAAAVARHVAGGAHRVSRETLEERLNICALCDRRTVDAEGRDRCSECGCPLLGGTAGTGGKAEWASQDCPLGKWPAPATAENRALEEIPA